MKAVKCGGGPWISSSCSSRQVLIPHFQECAAKSMWPLSVVSGIHLKVLPWWSMTTAKWVGGSWISSSRSRVDRKP